jgi:hypothetical protein
MLGVATIRRAESNNGAVQMTVANLQSVVTAFRRARVHFIREEGKGLGVFLNQESTGS